jgi:hypothetical protein
MFKAPLSSTQIDKLSLEAVETIKNESAFHGETLQISKDRLRRILLSTDTIGKLRSKYIDYRLGMPVTLDHLNAVVVRMKDDIGDKQGEEFAKIVIGSIDEQISQALKSAREV